VAIFLCMVRKGQCEICQQQFYIEDDLPIRCPHCGTRLWLYGVYSKDSVFIRQGVSTRSKTLNKGVTSAKRQAHGKKQWRRFRSKEDQKLEEGP
jgi:DNA-directed RNA polymerase subunit RPC12/RpoP